MIPVFHQRFVRFVLAGTLSTAAHWIFMGLLIAAGIPAAWATGYGALLGAACNYGLQYRVTFRSRNSHRSTFPRYLLACGAAWSLNIGLFAALGQYAVLAVIPAQLITTVVVVVMNYSLYQRIVFNERVSFNAAE